VPFFYEFDSPFVPFVHAGMLQNFVLLGDSQAGRFANLFYKRLREISREHCYSGFSINELKAKLKEAGYFGGPYLSYRYLLFIGTNDLLRFRSLVELKRDYVSLVKYLLRQSGWNGRVILVAIPPIPRLANKPEFWIRFHFLNRIIHSFASHPKVSVIEVKTYDGNSITRPELFERFYHDGRRDLIHINRDFCRELFVAFNRACESIVFEE